MSKKGEQTLKSALRKVIRDKKGLIHPNKQLLATILLGVLEGHSAWLSLALEQYGLPKRLNTTEAGEASAKDKDNLEAQTTLKEVYARILGGEDGSTDKSTSGNDSAGS